MTTKETYCVKNERQESIYTYDGFNRQKKIVNFESRVQVNHYEGEGLRHEMEENNDDMPYEVVRINKIFSYGENWESLPAGMSARLECCCSIKDLKDLLLCSKRPIAHTL